MELGSIQLLVGLVLGPLIFIGFVIGYIYLAAKVADAAALKGRNRGTWLLLALLFGVWLPAIIIAIMGPSPVVSGASNNEEHSEDERARTCPFCAEDIKQQAIKCKHCGEMLVDK